MQVYCVGSWVLGECKDNWNLKDGKQEGLSVPTCLWAQTCRLTGDLEGALSLTLCMYPQPAKNHYTTGWAWPRRVLQCSGHRQGPWERATAQMGAILGGLRNKSGRSWRGGVALLPSDGKACPRLCPSGRGRSRGGHPDKSRDELVLAFWMCILSCWLLSFSDLAML